MGLGHIFRSLTLANELAKAIPSAEIVYELYDFKDGVDVVRGRSSCKINLHKENSVPDSNWDILIIDMLTVDTSIIRELKKKAGSIVLLDDTGAGHFEADISINTLYAPKIPRPAGSNTKSFVGMEYLVINPVFSAVEYSVKSDVENIFLTQGGTDTYGVVPRVVESLSDWFACHSDITLNVHIGPAFLHRRELEAAVIKFEGRINLFDKIDDLAITLAGMDITISAAGMLACEIASVGVPMITVTDEKKELETAKMFETESVSINLGRYSSLIGYELPLKLDAMLHSLDMREQLSQNARSYIDGKGLGRVVSIIREGIV